MNADLLTAREIHRRLLGTDYMILGRGAAGIKAALNLQGYEATQPRRPSPPMSDTEISDLRAWMTADGLL